MNENEGVTILNWLAYSQPEVLITLMSEGIGSYSADAILSALAQAGISGNEAAKWAVNLGYDPDTGPLSPYGYIRLE